VALHFVLYRDSVALLEIVVLDVGGTLMALLGFVVIGHVLGRVFASLTISGLVLVLPVAGIGALVQHLFGVHVSELSAFVSLLGVGLGACCAGRDRRGAGLFGLLILAGAIFGLTRIHQPLESLVIASPYLILGVIASVWKRAGRLSH
jgi:hypothetical protein